MVTATDPQKIKAVRSLCTPNRVRILSLLQEDSACVCEMVAQLDMKHNLLSHHLSVLSDANIIENTRNGRHVRYDIIESRRPCVDKLLQLISHEDCAETA